MTTVIDIVTEELTKEKHEAAKSGKAKDPFYSEANMRRIRRSVQDAREGKVFSHALIED